VCRWARKFRQRKEQFRFPFGSISTSGKGIIMSVKAMGYVWDLDLPQNEKFVLLAYADHADHDGRNIFPSVQRIADKTGYSKRSVQGITRRLEERGLLIADGQGKNGTNKWRMPVYGGAETSPPVSEGVQPETEGVQSDAQGGAIATAPEPSLTIKEPSKRGDLVDGFIELSQMPGVKKQIRLEGIQSRIAVALNINATWSRWERFIRYADKREQENGEAVEQFFDWLKAKPGFDITYWPPDKMQEVWPQAFTQQKSWTPIPDVEESQKIIGERESKKFVPRPPTVRRPKIHQPEAISDVMKGMSNG